MCTRPQTGGEVWTSKIDGCRVMSSRSCLMPCVMQSSRAGRFGSRKHARRSLSSGQSHSNFNMTFFRHSSSSKYLYEYSWREYYKARTGITASALSGLPVRPDESPPMGEGICSLRLRIRARTPLPASGLLALHIPAAVLPALLSCGLKAGMDVELLRDHLVVPKRCRCGGAV